VITARARVACLPPDIAIIRLDRRLAVSSSVDG
jgi:hypothetical protein